MKSNITSFVAMAALTSAVFTTSIFADAIISPGNNPQVDENVLFSGGATGPLIEGTLNQSGAIVNLTSTSGNLLSPSSGQARIQAAPGNTTFSDLSFSLADGGTFTSAILNIFGASGNVTFTIDYLMSPSSPLISTFATNNGQNFFTLTATGDTLFSKVTISTDGTFNDIRQIRIGGYAGAADTPVANVPDTGTSLALLGLGLAGLAGFRQYARR